MADDRGSISAEGELASPHDEGLYEAGKKLLVDSVDVGREFCKYMIGISTGGIPIYVALLTLSLGKSFRPTVDQGLLLLLPGLLFLLGAAIFGYGYFPTKSKDLSLNDNKSIEMFRRKNIDRRSAAGIAGGIIFAVAVLVSLVIAAYALTLEGRATPAPPA